VKDRENKNEIVVYPVKQTMRKGLQRPPPDSQLEFLHGKRLLCKQLYRLFHCQLKSPGKFRMDTPVMCLFPSKIFPG
jgi:hypothetical protein